MTSKLVRNGPNRGGEGFQKKKKVSIGDLCGTERSQEKKKRGENREIKRAGGTPKEKAEPGQTENTGRREKGQGKKKLTSAKGGKLPS